MGQNFHVKFNINPPISIKVIEPDRNIDLILGLQITGVFTYSIVDEIAFYHQGFELNNAQKKNEFEGRILQSMHCSMSLFWTESVSKGIRHDDIPQLFDEMNSYVINDMQGGICKLTGIHLDSLVFDSTMINPVDEDRYMDAIAASSTEEGIEVLPHKIPPKTRFKWECPCGRINETNFCPGCGRPKDATSVLWICTCGKKNNSRFCTNCGERRD